MFLFIISKWESDFVGIYLWQEDGYLSSGQRVGETNGCKGKSMPPTSSECGRRDRFLRENERRPWESFPSPVESSGGEMNKCLEHHY